MRTRSECKCLGFAPGVESGADTRATEVVGVPPGAHVIWGNFVGKEFGL